MVRLEKTRDYVEPFNGSKALLLDWTDDGPPCWFNLRPNTSAGHGSNSEQWGYEFTQRSQTTLGADFPSPSESASPESTTNTASTPLVPGDTEGDSDTEISPATKSSLSPGVQAGIGVAAGVTGIGLGVLAAVMYMRRRKKQRAIQGLVSPGKQLPESRDNFEYKTELAAQNGGYYPLPPQPASGPSPLSGATPPSDFYETTKFAAMPNVITRQELDSQRPPTELPTPHDR